MTSVLMRLAARSITPVAVVLGVYLLVRGHSSPGGGFVAAIVVGLVVVLRHWALGPGGIERLLRLGVGHLIGLGLLLMLVTGALGWLWGDGFLATASVHLDPPVVGSFHLSTALLFETGIALTVVAIVVAVVRELRERDA